jgi:hypothetical protein
MLGLASYLAFRRFLGGAGLRYGPSTTVSGFPSRLNDKRSQACHQANQFAHHPHQVMLQVAPAALPGQLPAS